MILKDRKERQVEISNMHWPLAIDLFTKWGHDVNESTTEVLVVSVDDITPELSAWGIPWKRLGEE